jgi:hypothetical protein
VIHQLFEISKNHQGLVFAENQHLCGGGTMSSSKEVHFPAPSDAPGKSGNPHFGKGGFCVFQTQAAKVIKS